MNLCGSSGEGDVAYEVEPDCYLLARIDFRGAMVVNLGLGICKHQKKKKKKNERGRGKAAKWRGGGGGGGGGGE